MYHLRFLWVKRNKPFSAWDSDHWCRYCDHPAGNQRHHSSCWNWDKPIPSNEWSSNGKGIDWRLSLLYRRSEKITFKSLYGYTSSNLRLAHLCNLPRWSAQWSECVDSLHKGNRRMHWLWSCPPRRGQSFCVPWRVRQWGSSASKQ